MGVESFVRRTSTVGAAGAELSILVVSSEIKASSISPSKLKTLSPPVIVYVALIIDRGKKFTLTEFLKLVPKLSVEVNVTVVPLSVSTIVDSVPDTPEPPSIV